MCNYCGTADYWCLVGAERNEKHIHSLHAIALGGSF